MRVSLLPLDPPPSLRFFIRADGLHAGGITVHSVSGARFSYGIAVSGAMRRRGVASSALPLLFAAMKAVKSANVTEGMDSEAVLKASLKYLAFL